MHKESNTPFSSVGIARKFLAIPRDHLTWGYDGEKMGEFRERSVF